MLSEELADIFFLSYLVSQLLNGTIFKGKYCKLEMPASDSCFVSAFKSISLSLRKFEKHNVQ